MGRLVVYVGAGLMAEGLGFWDDFGMQNYPDPLIYNIRTWKDHRVLIHEFFNARRAQLSVMKPTSLHHLVRDLQRFSPAIFTQNIDDLLERDHCDGVVHTQGVATELVCTACACTFGVGYKAVDPDEYCPQCVSSGNLKPHVKFMGEPSRGILRLRQALAPLGPDDVFAVVGNFAPVDLTSSAYSIWANLDAARPGINAPSFSEVFTGRDPETLQAFVTAIQAKMSAQ